MSFWDESWNCINQEKLKSYINNFDFSEDDIIEILTENKKNKILDAGCGCGIYALKLAKNGFDVDGFDIADSAVTIATKIMKDNGFNGNFIGADIKETGFQSELYDAVVCKDVIDHMKKSDAAYDILYELVMNYKSMVLNDKLLRFYKVIYSERTTNKDASLIVIEETNKMINATKQLIKVLVDNNKLFIDDIEMGSISFSMTIHSLIDYELDCKTNNQDYDENNIQKYIKWFCNQYSKEE